MSYFVLIAHCTPDPVTGDALLIGCAEFPARKI